MQFVKVAEDEDEEPIELPIEKDDTLLQSTLQAQYPGCSGLKYRIEKTKTVRGIRFIKGRFYPPSPENKWGTRTYICAFPKETKRKNDDNSVTSISKCKRVETHKSSCRDLIILNLAYAVTDESLRKHFEKLGDILMAQVKKDPITGRSKGYGFIRFKDYEAQKLALSTPQTVEGRLCCIRIPGMKHGFKIYVGRCTEDLTANDLLTYFSKYGDVLDVYIPKPFRGFSFVTFLDQEVAKSLCEENHIVQGVSVHVSIATPKPSSSSDMDRRGGTREYMQSQGMPRNQHNDRWNCQNLYSTITPNLAALCMNPQLQNNTNQQQSQNLYNTITPNQAALGINPQLQNNTNQQQSQNLYNTITPNQAALGINPQLQNNTNQQQRFITLPVGVNSVAYNQLGMNGVKQNLSQDQGFDMRRNIQSGSSNRPAFERNEKC